MNRTFTDLIKFICCIAIFIHHFYLGSPYVNWMGYVACALFFFFSAYGVSKSLTKLNLKFGDFLIKRLWRIYKPLFMVNLLFVVATGYICNGAYGIPLFHVFCDNIEWYNSPNMYQNVLYILGLKKIDSVTWFLDVLFISYLFIWAVSCLKSRFCKNIVIVLSYSGWLCYCLILPPPSWYIVDTAGIALGLLVQNNEDSIKNRMLLVGKRTLIIIGLSIITILSFLFGRENSLPGRYQVALYLIACTLSILLIMISAYKVKLKESMVVSFLAGMSYFIYLIHVKVACVITEVFGDKNIHISILSILLLSGLFYEFDKRLKF